LTKPVVDGLERDLNGRAAVLRLDMLSGVGRDAASQYGVKAVPTTLLLDGNGQVILRQVGSVNAAAIRAQVANLTAAQ
jgi:thioredoxin-related protein